MKKLVPRLNQQPIGMIGTQIQVLQTKKHKQASLVYQIEQEQEIYKNLMKMVMEILIDTLGHKMFKELFGIS